MSTPKKLSLLHNAVQDDRPPPPDLASCNGCQRTFRVTDLDTETEGSYEEGYSECHVCPICADGGEIESYDYTQARMKEHNAWSALHGQPPLFDDLTLEEE